MKPRTRVFRRWAEPALRAFRLAWWRLHASDRRWVLMCAAALFVLTASGMVAWLTQGAARTSALHALTEAEAKLAESRRIATQRAAASVPDRPPWWAQLGRGNGAGGEGAATEKLSADALALADKVGVQVVRMSFSRDQSESPPMYRRTVVQLELKGRYPGVKQLLSELLARRPGVLALRAMDLRRAESSKADAAASDIDASIELRLFEPVAPAEHTVRPEAYGQ